SVRASMEVRHASSAWVNRAAYTKADVLFRIRAIPGVTVSTDMEIASEKGRFVIDTVEHVGRYVEILAHKVEPEGTMRKGQV
ncbi:MAG: head-tail adaptor protein, partial [Actinomycetaceae bacterium]|nr:head-tail adaptor protein [Actinomycetaceae bacterium]